MNLVNLIKELPNAHQHFHAANSGLCRHLFYPYKAQILKRYGVPDGYDVQRIKKECWVCNGEGVSYNPFSQESSDQSTLVFCCHCSGTGFYRNSTHYLQRYRLGDRTYHTPTPKDELIGDERELIQGFIEHTYSIPYPSEFSIQVCLLRWLPAEFLRWRIKDLRDKWRRSDDYYRYKFHRRWIREAWTKDDIPF